mmetsp:Transcript_30745/g.80471  ORF Transcript_30745/g.80471 Transcript_30745/m.80471 type:complete len:268 (-) Transcript_30745:416-1219(-)
MMPVSLCMLRSYAKPRSAGEIFSTAVLERLIFTPTGDLGGGGDASDNGIDDLAPRAATAPAAAAAGAGGGGGSPAELPAIPFGGGGAVGAAGAAGAVGIVGAPGAPIGGGGGGGSAATAPVARGTLRGDGAARPRGGGGGPGGSRTTAWPDSRVRAGVALPLAGLAAPLWSVSSTSLSGTTLTLGEYASSLVGGTAVYSESIGLGASTYPELTMTTLPSKETEAYSTSPSGFSAGRRTASLSKSPFLVIGCSRKCLMSCWRDANPFG